MKRRRNARSNTITTPYGKKVKVKARKTFEHIPPPKFDWIFLEPDQFVRLKTMNTKEKTEYLKSLLMNKSNPLVIRNEWFFNVSRKVVRSTPLYVVRADRRDRSLELVCGMRKSDSGAIEFSSPKKPMIYHI